MASTDSDTVLELRKMTRLFAAAFFPGSQRERIERLSAAGFTPSEVAQVLAIPLNIVTSDISRLKKKKSQAKGAKGGPSRTPQPGS